VIQVCAAIWGSAPDAARWTRDSRYGHRKEAANESQSADLSDRQRYRVPGGLPSRRLTLTLRSLRAPGLIEVRGFLLPRAYREPVRKG